MATCPATLPAGVLPNPSPADFNRTASRRRTMGTQCAFGSVFDGCGPERGGDPRSNGQIVMSPGANLRSPRPNGSARFSDAAMRRAWPRRPNRTVGPRPDRTSPRHRACSGSEAKGSCKAGSQSTWRGSTIPPSPSRSPTTSTFRASNLRTTVVASCARSEDAFRAAFAPAGRTHRDSVRLLDRGVGAERERHDRGRRLAGRRTAAERVPELPRREYRARSPLGRLGEPGFLGRAGQTVDVDVHGIGHVHSSMPRPQAFRPCAPGGTTMRRFHSAAGRPATRRTISRTSSR